MKTKILEFIDFEKVNTLLEGFNKSTGFVTAILDLEGNILSSSGWRQICTDFHRHNPETSQKCTLSDTVLAGKLAEGEKFHFYKCLNGLVDVAVPVLINGEHIANLFSGQFFFETPDIPYFRDQAKRYGFDETEYLNALLNVPVVSKEKVLSVMNFLLNMTNLISETTYQKHEQLELNKTIRESERRYISMLSSIELISMTLDTEGRITFCNDYLLKLAGWHRNEVLGKDWFNLFVPQTDIDSLRFAFKKHLADLSAAWHDESEIVSRSGEKRLIRWNKTILRSSADVVTGIASIGEDITELKKIENALIGEEEKYRHMFVNNPQPMLIYDIESLAILEINDSAAEHYGYTREEFLSMNLKDISPDSLNESFINAGGYNRRRNYYSEPTRHLKKNGEIILVELTSHSMLFNRCEACHVMINDVTEKKSGEARIREKDLQFRKLSVNVPDLIFQFTRRPDGSYHVPVASEGIRNIFGCKPEDVANDFTPVSRVIHPEDFDRVIADIESSARNLSFFTCEFRVLIPGRPVQWIYSRSSPERLPDGSVTWYGFNTDITYRKQADEAIRVLNAELEHRVADRTSQLEMANKELEAFSYSVSHDLRAPLRHINGFTEILTNKYSDQIPEEARKYLNTIVVSANKMGTLIDDLLSFSRTSRSELKKSTLKMDQVITDALAQIKTTITDRKITWEVSQLPFVRGDYNLLRQVCINLLDNAVKYTRTRELAVINIGYTEEEKDFIFFVKDNGVGFDMKYSDKLFGVFQRLHSSARFEGTGIGLANVQRIIQRHGGRTWAEAEIDKGAVFYFSIPKETEEKL